MWCLCTVMNMLQITSRHEANYEWLFYYSHHDSTNILTVFHSLMSNSRKWLKGCSPTRLKHRSRLRQNFGSFSPRKETRLLKKLLKLALLADLSSSSVRPTPWFSLKPHGLSQTSHLVPP